MARKRNKVEIEEIEDVTSEAVLVNKPEEGAKRGDKPKTLKLTDEQIERFKANESHGGAYVVVGGVKVPEDEYKKLMG